MEIKNDKSFDVRPDMAALYDISLILCGTFFCERCRTEPPVDSSEVVYSNRYYYRIAELAFDLGWRPQSSSEYGVLCPVCIAQQGTQQGRAEDGAPVS